MEFVDRLVVSAPQVGVVGDSDVRVRVALRRTGKGSLVMKRIGGHAYYYLAAREGRRVRFRYLGKLSEKERQERLAQHRQRGQYRRLLREVKQQIRFLERSLRG